MQTKKTFQIVDLKDQSVMNTYKSRKQAQKAADKFNFQHGAHRYAVRNVETGVCF